MAVRRFAIITENDARQIEPGTTVELEARGHVTPLAADTLRERRVTVVPAGSADRHGLTSPSSSRTGCWPSRWASAS